MSTSVVEMRHITKKFGNFKANDDISLTLHKGEILALLGVEMLLKINGIFGGEYGCPT